MAKSYDQKVVLFKAETTEGTDSVPSAAANAFRTLDYTPTFMDADTRVRQVDKPTLGANPTLLYNLKRGANFGVDMAGAGTVTGIPAWMVLARMARFGAPVAGGSSVVQNLTSTASPFSHRAYFLDEVDASKSLMLTTLGGRATMGFRLEDDDWPRFNFGYTGRPPATLAEELAFPSPTIANQAEPVIACTENTTFMLDGYALPLRSIELNSNAELALRSLIGPQDYIAYRSDAWGGTIVGELPQLSGHNYFAGIRTGATMTMQLVHGNIAGNIVQIDAPKVQISGNVDMSEEDGKLMFSMPVTLLPNAGNDEIVFTSK